MTSQHLSPFFDSMKHVLTTMFQTDIRFGNPSKQEALNDTHEVSALISFSGIDAQAVSLSFTTQTAGAFVERFLGTRIPADDPDFADAIGEIVNMVAGGAKARIDQEGASISCPTVVVGQGHRLFQRRDLTVIHIPCQTNLGQFSIEIAFVTSAQGRADHAA